MAVIPAVPESVSLHARLSMCFAALPPAEQKVAAYLLQNVDEHPDLPIVELAARAKVSKAVVVRMCQFLGFSGFREFRLEWARESPWQDRTKSGGPRLLASVFQDMQSTEDLLSVEAVDQAATAIVQAKHFFIYGSGGSYLVAELATSNFNDLGRLTVAFNESGWRSSQPVFADADTAVLVISHRGTNQVMKKVVDDDRKRGATIITLTSNRYSGLAQSADILLLTGCPSYSDITTPVLSDARVVQMACVHVLVVKAQELLRR